MSAGDQGRLLTAEVNWGGDSSAIFWVGTAPIHQFWPRLAPHFSTVLLAPQRRMDGEVVAWTWRESDHDESLTAAELLALRALLGASLELFHKAQPPRSEPALESGPTQGRTNLDLLWDTVAAVVAELVAKSDRDLLAFAVRTEAGPRIHSWGAKQAAIALAPEQLGHQVSGIVVAAGKAAEDVEVLMKNSAGEIQAKTLSDGTGRFRFSNVSAGGYRLFGQQGTTPFPSEGMEISVENGDVTGLKLRLASASEEPEPDLPSEEEGENPRWRKRILAGLLGAAVLAGAFLFWRSNEEAKPGAVSSETASPTASRRPDSVQTAARRSTSTDTTTSMGFNRRPAATPGPSGRSQGAVAAEASVRPGTAANLSSGSSLPTRPGADPLGARTRQPSAPSASPPVSVIAPETQQKPQRPNSSPSAPPAKTSQHSVAPSTPLASTEAESTVTDPPREIPIWAHQNQMTAEPWKIRLLVDPILPTDPTGDTSPKAVEALRQRVIAEQLEATPGTFRPLRASRGYTVQLPSDDPVSTYRWQVPSGNDPAVRTSIVLGRAELSWIGQSAPTPGIYQLTAGRGQPRFRLEVLGTSVATIARTAGVQASYWLEVGIDQAETGPTGRFSWQLASGGAIPTSWTGTRINRIDLPLTDSIGTEISSDLAFFDTVTGWAATTQLKFKSVSTGESPQPVP